MTQYKPDLKLKEAVQYIDSIRENPEFDLIMYYIDFHQRWHDKDKMRLREHDKFFSVLNNLLPNSKNRYA